MVLVVTGWPFEVLWVWAPKFRLAEKPRLLDKTRISIHTTPSGYFRDKNAELFSFACRHDADYVLQNEPTLLPLLSANQEEIDTEAQKKIDYFTNYYSNGEFSPDALRAWLSKHALIFFNVREWESYLASRSFAIGARFHGNVAAMHVGTPTLTLTFDSRTREMCEYLEMPSMPFIDFDGSADPDVYFEFANYSQFDKAFPRKYANYVQFLDKNGLPHNLEPADVPVPQHRMDFAGALAPHMDFAEKVRLLSLWEHEASMIGSDISNQEALAVLARLRSERSPEGRALAEKKI